MSPDAESAIRTLTQNSTLDDRQARMIEVMHRHGQGEFDLDYDTVMATMTDDTYWEFKPLGLRIEGPTLVKEWYRRILPVLIPAIQDAKETLIAFSGDTLIVEHEVDLILPDKSVHNSDVIALFEFRDDQILSEQLYCDPVWTDFYARAMRPDFVELSGVTCRHR